LAAVSEDLMTSRQQVLGVRASRGRARGWLEVLDAFGKEAVDGEKPKRRLEIVGASIDKESPGRRWETKQKMFRLFQKLL
jgi:hypothetical protein